jgi:membrane associated rhomboid family serine protease
VYDEEAMGPERMFVFTPWVRRLLVANLLVFLLRETVFTDPRFLALLEFSPLDALSRPWTFITYMFVHAGLLHLAFNLLALAVFGGAVEQRMGGRAFISYYLLCGLGGALLSYGMMLVVKDVRPVVGASGAIYGVMLAFGWAWPNLPVTVFPFPEPIPARWLVAFLLGLSLLLDWIGLSRGVAHLAHLGGIAMGFAYLKLQTMSLARAERRLRSTPDRGVLVQPAARAVRGSEPVMPKPRPQAPPSDRTHQEIDRVLDKISASGLASLTPAERKFLAEQSRRMRSQP